jgi:molybdate transport system ATP-binding protein
MASFRLTINFGILGIVSIEKGQGWQAHIANYDFVNTFFEWMEGRKHYPEASIEYTDESETSSDLYTISKYVKTVRFRLSDNESANYYYQQRYHATENDNIGTLRDYLGNITDPYFEQLVLLFGLDKLFDEKTNMLSSGEYRKAFFLKSAMTFPHVMLLEEPYAGIDNISCRMLNKVFEYLIQNGTSIVVFTSTNQRPDFLSHSINIDDNESDSYYFNVDNIVVPEPYCNVEFKYAFELKKIVANYNGRDVLHNVNWSVSRNQKWSLTGHNGAGKSTLLSFVNADNPQVYCNNVYLFDKKRGSGESIWEIKDQIGFYSSELHRYFNKLQTAEAALNSIVFQNPYEKRVLNSMEQNLWLMLLNYFDLEGITRKKLCDLSVITQKLVILTAVLLKNAPVLILDEPFQGFSNQLIRKSKSLINRYAQNRTFVMVSHNNTDFPECINKHFYLKNGIGREVDQPYDTFEYFDIY